MTERFAEGFVFKKLDVRGKVFIEYGPAEKAWCPIVADGYMHVDCFWVSGQFKGQGMRIASSKVASRMRKPEGKSG